MAGKDGLIHHVDPLGRVSYRRPCTCTYSTSTTGPQCDTCNGWLFLNTADQHALKTVARHD